MTGEPPRDISGLIAAWGKGNELALDRLMPLVYPELRRIARRHMARCQAGHTLESAALANEAYLKLVRAGGVHCENRVHFLALCSQIIRRILVDHARNRGYAKRGGGAVQIRLDEGVVAAKTRPVEWTGSMTLWPHCPSSILAKGGWWSCVTSAEAEC